MYGDKIDLYTYFKIDRNGAKGGILTVYTRTESKEIKKKLRPAMLVCPGGAYSFLSDREGEPVAIRYMAEGFVSFLLAYSLNTAYPVPLLEACMAIAYIRENAENYNVDKQHIASIGFSAGGHLNGMLATIYNEKEIVSALREKAALCRPDAVVLSYPVISMAEFTHEGSRKVISGKNEKLYDKLSIEKRVTKDSAPAFIWHTYEDNNVPVQNSLLLAAAYAEEKVPFDLHIFEKGWHGLSLADEEVNNSTPEDEALRHVGAWFNLSVTWLKKRGFIVKAVK